MLVGVVNNVHKQTDFNIMGFARTLTRSYTGGCCIELDYYGIRGINYWLSGLSQHVIYDGKSMEEGKDQELIQSSPESDPRNHMGK